MLVALGGALLIDRLGYTLPYRWMFLVLLLPALTATVDSVRLARVLGWWHVQPLSRLIAGTLFAMIGILMFLRLDTGFILPALIILLGIATAVRAVRGRSS